MSATQVAKLEALLARIHSRRAEPRLQLVDAAPPGAAASPSLALDSAPVGKTTIRRTLPPSLLTLDDPGHAGAVSAAEGGAPQGRSTPPARDVEMESDDFVDTRPPPHADGGMAAAPTVDAAEDALITAVARPVPEPIPAPPAPPEALRPVVMHVPAPVSSGPIASFVGQSPSQTLSFGQLVGLAMSLTTR